MKVKDVELGKRYAARLRMPAAAGMPRSAPIIHITAVDIAGNYVIGERPGMVLSAEGRKRRAANPDTLVGNRFWEPGTIRHRIAALDVICLSDEWQYDKPDGREEAPRIKYEGGQRIVEERLPIAV